MIKSYKDLDVWKAAIDLIKKLYIVTKDFPKEEIYGLVSQMRRSAVSISSNIAEGKMRQYTNEYIQFLYVSLGSCAELETQLIISGELGYINKDIKEELLSSVDQIGKMIRSLIKGLRAAHNLTPITHNP